MSQNEVNVKPAKKNGPLLPLIVVFMLFMINHRLTVHAECM